VKSENDVLFNVETENTEGIKADCQRSRLPQSGYCPQSI